MWEARILFGLPIKGCDWSVSAILSAKEIFLRRKYVRSETSNENIYVARTWHVGELLPGYIKDGWGYFCFKGKVIKLPSTRCQMLTGSGAKFVPPSQCDPLSHYIVGCGAASTPLYIGAFYVNGVQLCGEVRNGLCSIAGTDTAVLTEPMKYLILARIVQKGWIEWTAYPVDEHGIPRKDLVPCSPNNIIPSYVVGMLTEDCTCTQPGYAYCHRGMFTSGYFIMETGRTLMAEKGFYFLVGSDVSFRPNQQVPDGLRVQVGQIRINQQSRPVYIGTINIGGEEICGPVIDGVCYAYNCFIRHDSKNYKVLASDE
ncbi:Hypothetical predicted protein [Cloeon dipterum]|uniref:Uncharacterized protein n=1 Tax=Cloeon dipterum TaxID=197152 RepID=A0A8S1DTD9_9INSE|nr:Hypothetical predicted protein [Cloeon dipterum]